MANGNLFDTMQDISDAVTQAAKTGDFSHLNGTIQNSVADFVDGVGDTVAKGAEDVADSIRGAGGRWSGNPGRKAGRGTGRYTAFGNRQTNLHDGDHVYESPYRKGNATDETIERIRREKEEQKRQQGGRYAGRPGQADNGTASYFLQTWPSRSMGLGKRIGGIVGSVGFGLLTLFNILGVAAIGNTAGVIAFGILAAVTGAATGGFAYLSNKGKKEQDLVDHYYRYGNLVGGREFFAIDDLAVRAGEVRDKVRDNIVKMHQQGLLPHVLMDRNQTTVMLTDRSMQQYAEAEESRREREAEAGTFADRNGANGSGNNKPDPDSYVDAEYTEIHGDQENGSGGTDRGSDDPEVQKILKDGDAYIRQVRSINDRIPDTEEMSNKLYLLEDIMKRIFERVQDDPSKAKDIRKLMSYYLPTTMKLLNAYADLCRQPDTGDNVRNTKREIEDSMDTINGAFEKLLDDLFQDEAWDLSSDLNVMKTMMKQDGLVGEEKPEQKE